MKEKERGKKRKGEKSETEKKGVKSNAGIEPATS